MSRFQTVMIGVGEYARLTRTTAKAFTDRTGLPVKVLGDREYEESGLDYPHRLKFRMFDLVDATSILYVDADILYINDWDPMELIARNGVENFQAVRDWWFTKHIGRECERFNIPPDEYFNSGWMYLTRQHRHMLERAEYLSKEMDSTYKDQTYLNKAVQQLEIPRVWADRRCNWIRYNPGATRIRPWGVHTNADAEGVETAIQDLNGGKYGRDGGYLDHVESASEALAGKRYIIQTGSGGWKAVTLRPDLSMQDERGPGLYYWYVYPTRSGDGLFNLVLCSNRKDEYEIRINKAGEPVDGAVFDARSGKKTDKQLELDGNEPCKPAKPDESQPKRRPFEPESWKNSFGSCSCGGRCSCASMHNYVGAYQRVVQAVKPDWVVEWGPGLQTKIALRQGAQVIATEHDPEWIKREGDQLFQLRLPESSSHYITWGPKLAALTESGADLFFVDGRKRISCVKHIAKNYSDSGEVVFLHDAQRERYHKALKMFDYVHFVAYGCAVASNDPAIMNIEGDEGARDEG